MTTDTVDPQGYLPLEEIPDFQRLRRREWGYLQEDLEAGLGLAHELITGGFDCAWRGAPHSDALICLGHGMVVYKTLIARMVSANKN